MSKKQMLIVDDNHGLREALRTVFEDDFDLAFASRVSEHRRPQVVLMDYQMPGLDGVQTMQLLREQTPESRVIVMSAYDDHQRVAAAMRSGASDFVGKPFDIREIKSLVERAAATSDQSLPSKKPSNVPKTIKPKVLITQQEVDAMIDQTLRTACLN
jgi:DNA-binding NtrC family response regulator